MSSNSNMFQGYIKLYRSILDWEWFDDPIVLKVFIWCLMKANIEDKKWHGKDIKRGQFVSSYQKIAEECNISVWQARRSITALKTSNNVTSKSHSKYTLFTVVLYDSYQAKPQANSKQGHNKTTTTKEIKKYINKGASDVVTKRDSDGEFVDGNWLPKF